MRLWPDVPASASRLMRRRCRNVTVQWRRARDFRVEATEGRAKSVSAFVSEAVEQRLEHDSLQGILDAIFRDNPMTDQEREWADSILRG
jgi:hypothetical protein